MELFECIFLNLRINMLYIYSESYKSNSVIYIYYINNRLPMTLDNSPNQEKIYLDIFM